MKALSVISARQCAQTLGAGEGDAVCGDWALIVPLASGDTDGIGVVGVIFIDAMTADKWTTAMRVLLLWMPGCHRC